MNEVTRTDSSTDAEMDGPLEGLSASEVQSMYRRVNFDGTFCVPTPVTTIMRDNLMSRITAGQS